MTEKVQLGLAAIQQQMRELDEIAKKTTDDLNTVAGSERVTKWKARTVALLSQAIGEHEGKAFARQQPGPSFTNDLFEEFTDLVDYYRSALRTMAKKLESSVPKTS
jgi:hypothetical protein